MTRKHYQLIAKAMNDIYRVKGTYADHQAVIGELATQLSAAFLRDNPRFNERLFNRAVTKTED